MSEHSKEPWEVAPGGSPRGMIMVKTLYGYPGMDESQLSPCYASKGVNAEANARRIVACINACAGISTEVLENDGRYLIEVVDLEYKP